MDTDDSSDQTKLHHLPKKKTPTTEWRCRLWVCTIVWLPHEFMSIWNTGNYFRLILWMRKCHVRTSLSQILQSLRAEDFWEQTDVLLRIPRRVTLPRFKRFLHSVKDFTDRVVTSRFSSHSIVTRTGMTVPEEVESFWWVAFTPSRDPTIVPKRKITRLLSSRWWRTMLSLPMRPGRIPTHSSQTLIPPFICFPVKWLVDLPF